MQKHTYNVFRTPQNDNKVYFEGHFLSSSVGDGAPAAITARDLLNSPSV